MIIGFTVNNILRDHLTKLEVVYKAITGKVVDLPINPYDLDTYFPNDGVPEEVDEFNPDFTFTEDTPEIYMKFNDSEEVAEFDVYKFMYTDASFEIFGSAEEAVPGLIRSLSDVSKTSEHNIMLTNLESSRSKSATLFFLSKNFFDMKEIYFPDTREEMWDKFDVIVTDDPKICALKRDNKKVIKIENGFNMDAPCDLSVPTLNELIKNLDDYLKVL